MISRSPLPDFRRLRGTAGFSLIEVILAVGVFAIGILAVIGMLPNLLSMSKEAWQETRAAQIGNQIVRDLNSGADRYGFIVTDVSAAAPKHEKIDLTEPGSWTIPFDQEGTPQASSETATFDASVAVTPDAARPGLSNVTVTVRQAGLPTSQPGFVFQTKVTSKEVSTEDFQ